MKTKIQLINDCFAELRISGLTSQPDNPDIALAIGQLEDFVVTLPFDIDYNFENTPNPNSLSGIPAAANSAISMGLAVRIAGLYGKAPESLLLKATATMSALQNKLATPGRVAYPSRQPLGMGNRRAHNRYDAFMPETIKAPTSSDTEQMTLGDINSFFIDFGDILHGSTSIVTYTHTETSGILASAFSQTLTRINFTVQANDTGFQQILFVVTSNTGTKVNRVLNFNVNQSTSIRANP